MARYALFDPRPRPPRGMADVNNFDRLGFDHPVENLIAIAAEYLHAYGRIGSLLGRVRERRNIVDGCVNRAQHISGSDRTSRFKIKNDAFEIADRPCPVADPHAMP